MVGGGSVEHISAKEIGPDKLRAIPAIAHAQSFHLSRVEIEPDVVVHLGRVAIDAASQQKPQGPGDSQGRQAPFRGSNGDSLRQSNPLHSLLQSSRIRSAKWKQSFDQTRP